MREFKKAAAGVAIGQTQTAPAIPSAIPSPTVPIPVLPGIPAGTVPTVQISSPTVVPGGLTIPAGGPPPFVPPSVITQARPAEPGAPATSPGVPPPSATPPTTSTSGKDNTLALAAGGGVLGFLLAGPVGGLIGATAGAVAGGIK